MKNKALKITLLIIFLLLLIYSLWYVIKTNTQENAEYTTETPVITTIEQKAIATGKINPKEKIDIKPNISGIIKEVFVKEGDEIKVGELIATIRVVPVVASVNTAMQSINSAKIQLNNQQRIFNRQKLLYSQGVISQQEYESSETEYKMAQQTLKQAQQEYEIARTGIAPGLEDLASIQIRSTANGIALEVPVEVGDQVIEANTFNAGTTIASVADTSKMIFEGKVDESDAGKMTEGMPLKIVIGALRDKSIDGKLSFISPQGKEENGAVKYEIKADILKPENVTIRAGYSANAEVILNERKNILAVREALIQYENDKPFVEILQPNNKFKKVFIKLGLSDGLFVEVQGINKTDKIKIWNPSESDTDKNNNNQQE
ncbi:efflux RND transporter periplasmic adaptor subunit [Apibacter raozihei]|uniref:efflux RND transporter periplasmic adaptor subunit n=1 Tax=Apibacter TaxID=1778601 RepID=UPI000FE42BE4|nr:MULTISPECIES: efflux RND transporter periplasmic adaptor subunit [Apibacter]